MPPSPRKQTAPAPAASPAVPETPLEDTNPPGPAEGVEQPSGPPEGHDTPVGSDTTTPTAAEVVDPDLENSTEGDAAPGWIAGPTTPGARLAAYLGTHYPEECTEGQDAADIAIRLLTRFGAKGATQARCTGPYCNLPAGHTGMHGWVHVEP